MTLLDVKNLKKVYTTRFSSQQVVALSNVSFSVEEGEYVAIMGESGSGKTTLLNILASLDTPTSGSVLLNGEDLTKISEKKISQFRITFSGQSVHQHSDGRRKFHADLAERSDVHRQRHPESDHRFRSHYAEHGYALLVQFTGEQVRKKEFVHYPMTIHEARTPAQHRRQERQDPQPAEQRAVPSGSAAGRGRAGAV